MPGAPFQSPMVSLTSPNPFAEVQVRSANAGELTFAATANSTHISTSNISRDKNGLLSRGKFCKCNNAEIPFVSILTPAERISRPGKITVERNYNFKPYTCQSA
jgi:hypothetical protein